MFWCFLLGSASGCHSNGQWLRIAGAPQCTERKSLVVVVVVVVVAVAVAVVVVLFVIIFIVLALVVFNIVLVLALVVFCWPFIFVVC